MKSSTKLKKPPPKLDPKNLPIAKPIPLEHMHAIEQFVDWNEYYARLGTTELIYAEYYNGKNIPEHLKNVVTHAWVYFEK